MKNYRCTVGLENGTIYEYYVDANDAKHAKNKLYRIMSYEGITNVYKINIEEESKMFKAIKDGQFWNPTFNQEVITGIRGRNKEDVLMVAELFEEQIIQQQEDNRNHGLLFYAAGFDGKRQQDIADNIRDQYEVEVF